MSNEQIEEEIVETEAKAEEESLAEETKEVSSIEIIQALEERVKTAEDKQLRGYAELENFKRRKEQELDNFKKYADEKLIKELLPIVDNFFLACDQKQEKNEDNLSSFLEGFILIKKQFDNLFERIGLEPIQAVGETFNPNLHQAIMQEKVEDKDAGIVLKEMQRGFTLKGRVIRPSMVVVSE